MDARWTVPNVLTVARMILAAVAAWLAVASQVQWVAVVILIAAALLDAFDGWYARAFAQSSGLGKHLDPFADKVLVTVILVWIGVDTASMAAWVLIGLLLARDAAMTVIRVHSARIRGRLIPASMLGRWKMFVQSAGGLVILSVSHILDRPVHSGWVIAVLAAMLVVSLAAMVGYIKAKGPAADHEQTHFALRSPG
ncbi:MAG TPA: CDP-alcohol phosphatidyltransferase family protein [Candidatus Krumholzibacteria bacterium]